jgi:3-methylcrotonyl-CoA carboxylase alpha subunit
MDCGMRRLLIANRGEIACRIIRTCRRLGIETMAVHSSADARARTCARPTPPWRSAARRRPRATSTARIIEAALAAGVDAIHPGYGFLSENAGFARACADGRAGVRRPARRDHPPHGLEERGQGDHGGRRRAGRARLPRRRAVAGRTRSRTRRRHRLSAADQGLGRRRRQGHARGALGGEFADALAAARREALKAFGDEQVILERYIERPRHIEVQVFGDRHGNVVHLWERECSTQRRYQKVIEESPSPLLDDATRQRITPRPPWRRRARSTT